MNPIQTASVIIFLLTIILIVTERIHRMYAALLGSGAMVFVGAVSAEEVLHFIDIEILGVIVGMMLLVRGAERSGIFNVFAKKITKASKSITSFAIIMMVLTFVLSIFLENIGGMLIMATITIPLAKSLKIKPETFLIFQAIIVNIGGMMLLMSSIPNIIVAVEGGISFSAFLVNIAPIGIILFVVTLLIFIRVFGSEVEKGITQEMRALEFSDWVNISVRELDEEGEVWRMAVAALIMVFTIIGFAVYDQIGLTPAFVAMAGGFLMIMFSGEGPTESLRGIDWSTVIFLAGLFVLVNCLDKNGLIDMLSDWMLNFVDHLPVNMPTAVMWLSAVPSGVVDNIPLTATLAPVMSRWIQEGASAKVWWGLVLGANLGGCLTPIGSPSSIIAIGVAEQEGHPIPLGRFFVICFGVTMVNLIVSTIYLYFL
ncbi:MAG: SLC13 family permease [Candidatus Bathyarchaeota archaeon]|nr:SLC13 family permease [Candidatus Bathyarchaeota archaeon]